MVCGDPLALSLIVSVPVRFPADTGVKVTERVQVAAGARLEVQVFVSPKPSETETEVMFSAADPELVNVTICGALIDPST